ncbi:MAG: spectinomycin phosphotransferase [candidate division WS6 bacterium 34_10]|jgi:thiamine kinase-like enzyme|uniref:Spectinomycin phosphotransferase n=1 Tax=candidate division WS6 bacterium 34_10 TaxID=1641389 RepID=A0A101HJ09_9BACT|nr:MAG: spectinomycin phosphotransferase [candidate division WS6 bacterium 34_10]
MQKVSQTLENELREYLKGLSLDILQMNFVPLGEESYCWKVETKTETLFLKYCTQERISRNLSKINSLLFSLSNYDFIVPPIPINGKTEQPFKEGYIYASNFIEGKVQPMSTLEIPSRVISRINAIMAQIHTFKVDIEGFSKENFNYNFREEYTKILNDIDKGKEIPELTSKDVKKVDAMIVKLEKMTANFVKNSPSMVLTHGDITGGNIVETKEGGIKLLDWDEAKIAPKERDINFINDHPAFEMEVYKKITGIRDIDQNLTEYYGLVWSLESIIENSKKLQYYKEEYGTREYLMEDIIDSLNSF